MSLSRRTFVTAAASVPTLAADSKIPERVLGRTGRKVPFLVFGCGSRFLSYPDDQADGILNEAFNLGIRYFDTAKDYGNGKSEERVGRALAGKRNEIFLTTKVPVRDYDGAMRTVEQSLQRLRTDHVDLLHVHALMGDDDLAKIEAPNGVLKALYKLREQKAARAIGVTCHAYPDVLAKALERHDFDCTQMALNAARAGMITPNGQFTYAGPAPASFESIALPVAKKKNLGVIAMKVFAQEALNGKATPEQLIRYSLSLPVSACVVGMPKPEMLQQNVAIAKAFQPMPRNEMDKLSATFSPSFKAGLDQWFADHQDA